MEIREGLSYRSPFYRDGDWFERLVIAITDTAVRYQLQHKPPSSYCGPILDSAEANPSCGYYEESVADFERFRA